MYRIYQYSFLILALSFFSCKKDKLKDEKAILEGKWRWIFTNEGINDPNYSGNKTPATEGKNYSVEFLSCGIIKFFENGNEQNEYRIVFANFDQATHPLEIPAWGFEIYPNNKSENNIAGAIYDRPNDTLFLRGNYGYPFSGYFYVGGVEERYINYFVREN